jgi:hypothetical protein
MTNRLKSNKSNCLHGEDLQLVSQSHLRIHGLPNSLARHVLGVSLVARLLCCFCRSPVPLRFIVRLMPITCEKETMLSFRHTKIHAMVHRIPSDLLSVRVWRTPSQAACDLRHLEEYCASPRPGPC